MCAHFTGEEFRLHLLYVPHEVTYAVFQEVTFFQEVQFPGGVVNDMQNTVLFTVSVVLWLFLAL